jgi:hypothetical protein
MAEPQTKGINFGSFTRTLARLKGDHVLADTLAALPPDLGGRLRVGTLLTGNWYPLSWYLDLHRAARRVTGAGPEFARTVGYENTLDDLKGVYRIFIKMLSPQFVISKSTFLFNTYYDTGKMTVTDAVAGSALAHWSGCTGFDHNLWQDILGGSQAGLVLSGARDIQLETLSGGKDGDDFLEVRARWS